MLEQMTAWRAGDLSGRTSPCSDGRLRVRRVRIRVLLHYGNKVITDGVAICQVQFERREARRDFHAP